MEKENEVVVEENEVVVEENEVVASASAWGWAWSEDESRSSNCHNDQTHVSNSTQVEGGPIGFGLKRWRRLKRDSSKDPSPPTLLVPHPHPHPHPDPIRLLKRSSSPNNFIDRIHAPNPDTHTHAHAHAHADAHASVSSTNAFAGTALIFTPGPADSDNSDDRSSSKSSTAASAPKSKHRPKSLNHLKPKPKPNLLDSSKKHQPHAPSLHSDNPFSSVDSHPAINPPHNSDDVEPSFSLHSQTHFSCTNDTHHSPIANCGNHLQATSDPLVNSLHMLRSAQITLQREVERYQELGREVCSYPGKNVGTLETRLGEGEGRVKEREMKIVELEEARKNMIPRENGTERIVRWQDMEGEVESILKEKIEAEIEHLVITRYSKDLSVLVEDEMKVMREQKGAAKEEIKCLRALNNDVMQIQQGMEGGENIMSMRRKAVSFAKYFGIQLSLLLFVLALFISRFTPKSAVVVPT